ncbi:MAG: hypothetical protein R6U43_10805 [Candidatus Krumholzibacteriales bacterium]
MKASAELWVKLKVTDLVVETAWFTLTEKLDFTGSLYGLSRYSCWFISAAGPDGEAILDELDGIVKLDSAFINQNKHKYSLVLSENGAGRLSGRRGDFLHEEDFVLRESNPGGARLESFPEFDLYACDCLVTEEGGGADYSRRLSSRAERIDITGVKPGQVWRLILRAESGDQASRLVEEIAVTRSRKEGLLLNPHYQSHEIMGIELISGTGE